MRDRLLTLMSVAIFLLPPAAVAHPGHGVTQAGHELQHMIWLLAGVGFGSMLLVLALRRARNRR